MNPSRLSTPSAVTQLPKASPWEPARLLLAALGGLFVMAILSNFLDEDESGRFVEFLKGQVGFDGMSSWLFWKMAIGFAIGAAGGYFVYLEIPRSYRKNANALALAVALFLIPVTVYIPAMSAGFIWDDDQEVTSNPSILHNFPDPTNPRIYHTNWRGLWEIWTGGITNDRDNNEIRLQDGKPPAPLLVQILRVPLRAIERELFGGADKEHYRFRANPSADYFPLKTTMLWLEYQLWGFDLDTGGRPTPSGPPFHTMNILIHALDGLLLWMVLRQLKVPGAWLGSLLFAIHPVHAESIAWIAERKNTLSLFFCLLSVSAWLKWQVSGKRNQYLWALVLFLGALLCKTHVVVLPAVLMLMTWWQTGSIPVASPALTLLQAWRKGEKKLPWDPLKRDSTTFAPFFAIALALSWLTVWFQNDRAIGSEVIPIGDAASRIAGAGVVIWSYLSKAILPINLNTIYANTPYLWWPLTDPQVWMFFSGALVLVTLGLLWKLSTQNDSRFSPRTLRTPFFVFAFFVGTLLPIVGLFKMSYMRLTLQADHFQYFSDISVVALAGAAIALLYEKANASWRPILVSTCVIVIFTFCTYSWDRAGVHQSEKTLWTACLKKNEASWQAHNHIGAVLYSERNIPEAAPHFARAVELKPDNPEVHNNLGLVLWQYGHYPEAIAQYREAVRIKGEVMALRRNLADALLAVKQPADAAEQYQIIIDEYPNDPGVLANLSIAYAQIGRFQEALKACEKALRIDPNNPVAKQNYNALRQAAQ